MHRCASLCIAVLSFAVPIHLLHQVCSSFVVSLLKVLNFPSLLPISTVFPALKMFTDRFDVSKVRSHHATCPPPPLFVDGRGVFLHPRLPFCRPSQAHLAPYVSDLMKLVARAMVSDSYFATADTPHPIETPTTPFLIADFEDDEEYKALFSNVKSRAMATLQALARQWPVEALQEARFLAGQMVPWGMSMG